MAPRRTRLTTPAQKAKFRKVMHEFKHHTLHTGGKHGPLVHTRNQAIAIGFAEARALKRHRHRRTHKRR